MSEKSILNLLSRVAILHRKSKNREILDKYVKPAAKPFQFQELWTDNSTESSVMSGEAALNLFLNMEFLGGWRQAGWALLGALWHSVYGSHFLQLQIQRRWVLETVLCITHRDLYQPNQMFQLYMLFLCYCHVPGFKCENPLHTHTLCCVNSRSNHYV